MELYTLFHRLVNLCCILSSIYYGFADGAKKKGKVEAKSLEARLFRTLLDNYEPQARPRVDPTVQVNVTLSLYLTQIEDLNEKSQVLATYNWVVASWNDDFLVWDPAEYGGLTNIYIPASKIWVPDIGVDNSVGEVDKAGLSNKFLVPVDNTGYVKWMPLARFTTSCTLDMTNFPFDKQICSVDLMMRSQSGQEVNLLNGSHAIYMDTYNINGQWDIAKTISNRKVIFYACCPGLEYPKVIFEMHMDRKAAYYVMNIIVPCVLMSLLSCLVFYLPPDAGEKVSLGITVLLAFSVNLLIIAENMPKTSDFIPVISIYLALIMCMTGLSIFFTVFVLNLHHKGSVKPVPHWMRRIVFGIVARVVCMRSLVPDTHKEMGYRKHKTCPNGDPRVQNFAAVELHVEEVPHVRRSRDPMSDSRPGEDVECLRALLHEIIENQREIRTKLLESEVTEALKEEWQLVAKVLDRFFLFASLITIVGATILMLGVIPAGLL